MSGETAEKQSRKHADLSDNYQSLDALLATGEVLRESPTTVRVYGQVDGTNLVAVLKRAGAGRREIYLQTFHRYEKRQYEKARSDYKPLRAAR